MTLEKSILEVGALAAPLHKQLNWPAEDVAPYQADFDAITRLRIRGLLTPPESHRATKRTIKRMDRELAGLARQREPKR